MSHNDFSCKIQVIRSTIQFESELPGYQKLPSQKTSYNTFFNPSLTGNLKVPDLSSLVTQVDIYTVTNFINTHKPLLSFIGASTIILYFCKKYYIARNKEVQRILRGNKVKDILQNILEEAISKGASDLHIEPGSDGTRIRIRVDGILHEISTIPNELHTPVVARIKIMANLNISERRHPQDGRYKIVTNGNDVDLRVSTLPSMYGEKVVMRILNKNSLILDINDLGLLEKDQKIFTDILQKPFGIILVTGPSGSGKTTTLYSALSILDSSEKHIVTIEDPIEYELGSINQVQVNHKAGVSFAEGLRSILRQDPDIIMVGEIRDRETAEIAIRAGLTGHLVISTLHSNNTAGAIARLNDMGVESGHISSSVLAVFSQRLVRKICTKCKGEYIPDEELVERAGMSENKDIVFYKGYGCDECNITGYKGRIGLYELMVNSGPIRKLIHNKASSDIIYKEAIKGGLMELRELAKQKIIEGTTTIEEMLNATADIK